MRRLLWASVILATFLVGWATGGVVRKPPTIVRASDPDQETIARLQAQVDTLQARLRAREDLAMARQSGGGGTAPAASDDRSLTQGFTRSRRGDAAAPAPVVDRVAVTSRAPASPQQVQAALDRFYKYLESVNANDGQGRWRQAREMVDELRAMGPAAGQALMQVLSAANDSDERRAAARLLGQLQVAQALPLLKSVVDTDQDLLTRRAAAFGLRQLQTPESVPVMEQLLVQPGQDRFVRLSAAAGLADQGKAIGVTGLTQIFDEAAADGRGRDMAFRALSNLKDDRPVPFMRDVVTSQVEPNYRVQAIRYLGNQGDQQSLGTLQAIMNAPNEQPSIRDAASQAFHQIQRTTTK